MMMDKWIAILWTVLLGANLGLTFFIVKWIVREFTSDVKDAVRTVSAWNRIGGSSELLALKYAILDGQKESEASLKKYIMEQMSEDKTLGSTIKLGDDVYVITSIAKNCTYGEAESADVSLRKAVE